MGLIDMMKPLSTVLSSVVNKSRQHQEKIYREHQESNPGPLDAKQEAIHCDIDPPPQKKKHPSILLTD